MFTINRKEILHHSRVTFVEDVVPIHEHLDNLEKAINTCFVDQGDTVVQHGRVIALRTTDENRLSSAFKSALYLGKYNDMENKDRFLKKMVAAGHSYEPIRGENVLFLYIGVGKPVYDHMVTYSVGRPTRIAGGQRANLPWGYEVPADVKQDGVALMSIRGIELVEKVIDLTKGLNEEAGKQQIQAARSLLPVGYVMPPFLLEFTEEALIKTVFRQRLWEKGAQGATVDVVSDMWQCMMKIDPEKWEHLLDYHGPHIEGWRKAMRTIRDKEMTISGFIDLCIKEGWIEVGEDDEIDLSLVPMYEMMMATVGKLPPSMWDKKK